MIGSWFGALTSKDTVFEGKLSHDSATRRRNVTAAIAATGRTFANLGMKTGFVVTVPGSVVSVPEALARRERLGFGPEARRTKDDYYSTMEPVITAAKSTYDDIMRTDDLLCKKNYCEVTVDGRPLYYDNNHPSLFLNEYAYTHLLSQLRDFLEKP